MVCRVRQSTPDRQVVPYDAELEDDDDDYYDNSETEPDDSDLLTDPEDCLEVNNLPFPYLALRREFF